MTIPATPTTPAAVLAAPVARTSGSAVGSTIMRKIPVAWALDTTNGHVTANGEYAGRVIESIPGKLYYFQTPEDAARGDLRGMHSTASTAAERGAVRAVLCRNNRP